ncbi:hypothetical protein [Altericroceibacterium spongiae]|uniref:hypothetical protein n=1 Tax=Altericroceibacterium spongiae TaxID=2320269 RepID=UPI001EE51C13|nr:hypothetical protein [Altericroceibacterium spongiae]
MINADGDDLVFHRIVFFLAKGVIGKNAAKGWTDESGRLAQIYRKRRGNSWHCRSDRHL